MTDFQECVRNYVKEIPLGEVRTYSEVATAVGRPKAARAVANIMAANYDRSIPCHRVVRADGTLGGYNRGGAAVKRALLIKEGVTQYIHV